MACNNCSTVNWFNVPVLNNCSANCTVCGQTPVTTPIPCNTAEGTPVVNTLISCNVPKCNDGCVETFDSSCITVSTACFYPEECCDASTYDPVMLSTALQILCTKIAYLEAKVACLLEGTDCDCTVNIQNITIS